MKKKFLAVVLAVIFGVIGIRQIQALQNDSTLSVEYVDNVYSYRYRNGILRSYGKLPIRYQNNELTYCIDPDTYINSNTYSSTNDWSITGFSEDVKRQMELIVHYGYEYPGHDTVKYYMATQELIWLYTDDYVKWVDAYSTDGSKGNQINIENEKSEILRLIQMHDVLPSFANQSYTGLYGEILTLTDTNNVIDNYNIETNLKYEKNGSTIKFYLNKFGENTINLTMKNDNKKLTTVYYVDGIVSQKMVLYGFPDVKKASVTLSVDYANIRVNKRDIQSKNLILKEAKFLVKEISDASSINSEFSTSEKGYFEIALKKGEYELTELKAPDGYLVNKNKIKIKVDDDIDIKFSTNKDELFYNVDVYNEKPKGNINVIKVDEDGNELYGVEIGLFDKNHKKISSLITNKDSNIFSDLSLGTYYIKELNTLDGYILDNKEYKVQLSYVDDNTSIVKKSIKLVNEKIKCDVVYITSSDNEKLSDVEINVYDSNDNIVFNGKTNSEGKLTISGLPYGKYYIKQIKVPKGYILSEDEYVFYVNDSTCLGSIDVENEKTIMPVTTSSLNIGLLFAVMLSSFGAVNYVKKNN